MARIALIAPDFLTRQDQRIRLEARGHKIVSNPDLARAMEALLNDPPDLLIIQRDLPGHLDRDVVQALKNNLRLALLPVLLVVGEGDFAEGLDWDQYPVDDLISLHSPFEEVVTRVELALARTHRVADNNPLTGLPGNSSILKAIQSFLDQGLERAVAYVDIDNFKPYNDRYGFARGDEVIRVVARVMVNVIQEISGSEGFVGHVGGDDFVFAVPLGQAEQVCEEIIRNFSSLINLFLDEEDLEAGCFISKDRSGAQKTFPLTTLSIAVIPCIKGRYSHYGEVAEVAAQVKKKVKSLPGSNYFIDRRKRP